MLRSEVHGWQWVVSWDNAKPATSKTMLAALSALGNLTDVQTKTTYILAPKSTVGWRDIRAAIVANLDPVKGNATYTNLRTGRVFEYGSETKFKWKKLV